MPDRRGRVGSPVCPDASAISAWPDLSCGSSAALLDEDVARCEVDLLELAGQLGEHVGMGYCLRVGMVA